MVEARTPPSKIARTYSIPKHFFPSAFRNWMNSLGANPFVTHLYNNLHDGLVLFQVNIIVDKSAFFVNFVISLEDVYSARF